MAALREQLSQRSGTLVRVHGMLVDVQAELEARAATQLRLESTHQEPGNELQTLRAGLESERAQREQLDETLEPARSRRACATTTPPAEPQAR